jgi:hypothetical protein
LLQLIQICDFFKKSQIVGFTELFKLLIPIEIATTTDFCPKPIPHSLLSRGMPEVGGLPGAVFTV